MTEQRDYDEMLCCRTYTPSPLTYCYINVYQTQPQKLQEQHFGAKLVLVLTFLIQT